MTRRAAVVVNAARLRRPERLRRQVERAMDRHGWMPPLWLETTADDPGTGQAETAAGSGADLILAVGGDGTARAVLAALAGSPIPVALLPSGTGNVLARNLRIPLKRGRALHLALTGHGSPMDLLRWTTTARDGHDRSGLAAVMIGVGADAAVLSDTDEALKRLVGKAAYLVAGVGHVRAVPVTTTVTFDSGESLSREASLVEVGNVGDLTVGVSLLPAASARDGRLDVLIASPRRVGDVARMIGGVLLQRTSKHLLDRRSGSSVEIRTGRPVLCQVDGDLIGEVVRVRVEVAPGTVRVVLP